jgi:acyl-CoA hydrolase
MQRETIWNALARKLGRQPTNAEAVADVRRILQEGLVERAEAGKLRHQRKR